MNDLEITLRLWAPRRPSAKVEQNLFAKPPTAQAEKAVTESHSPRFNFAWVAPATAALLLMGMLFNQRNSPSVSGSSGSPALVALIMSNQNAAAYLPGNFQPEQNKLRNTFEWTNRSGLSSSIRSLSHLRGINRDE